MAGYATYSIDYTTEEIAAFTREQTVEVGFQQFSKVPGSGSFYVANSYIAMSVEGGSTLRICGYFKAGVYQNHDLQMTIVPDFSLSGDTNLCLYYAQTDVNNTPLSLAGTYGYTEMSLNHNDELNMNYYDVPTYNFNSSYIQPTFPTYNSLEECLGVLKSSTQSIPVVYALGGGGDALEASFIISVSPSQS